MPKEHDDQKRTQVGTGGGGRTHTPLREPDFESGASANSATPASLITNDLGKTAKFEFNLVPALVPLQPFETHGYPEQYRN
jgi:hypothetical protein